MNKFPGITDDAFSEIIKSYDIVLVIFSSIDCGYCQLAKKNLLQIVELLDDLKIYQCQISEAADAVDKYNITSVPVMKLFKEGEIVHSVFGVRRPMDLYYDIKPFLPRSESYCWPD